MHYKLNKQYFETENLTSKSLKIKPFLTQQLKELHARILKGFNLQELLRQLWYPNIRSKRNENLVGLNHPR